VALAASEVATEPTRRQRREFVQALVEHSWARPEAQRTPARPHIVLMVAAFSVAAAIAAGAVLQLVHPIPLPKAPLPPPNPAAPFTAVTGWDCSYGGTSYGFEAQGRTGDWYTVATGGWTQDGCHGDFETIPMSGQSFSDDPSQFAQWWFNPPAAMTQCAVMVFRPAPNQQRDPIATAAQFEVLAGSDGTPLAAFVLDEAEDPGSWAAVGTFPVSQDGIAVELVDSGVPATAGARLAITQVKVRCTGLTPAAQKGAA
jgi:hypothetical protein